MEAEDGGSRLSGVENRGLMGRFSPKNFFRRKRVSQNLDTSTGDQEMGFHGDRKN